jgi:hypothetical protein
MDLTGPSGHLDERDDHRCITGLIYVTGQHQAVRRPVIRSAPSSNRTWPLASAFRSLAATVGAITADTMGPGGRLNAANLPSGFGT